MIPKIINDINQNYLDYNLLFSDSDLVKEILSDIVKEDKLFDIDINTLESVNTSFITEDLKDRFSDKTWRIRLKEEWLYLYILIEFQYSNENISAKLIDMELCKSTEEIREHIARLLQNLTKSENHTIERSFSIWISHLLKSNLKIDNIPECQTLKEVDSMLAETITEWTEQWEVKGIGKGELIGRICLLQQILKKNISSKEELIAKEMSELKTLCESIEKDWQAVQN
jgi:hypothetical protein